MCQPSVSTSEDEMNKCQLLRDIVRDMPGSD
jgi:hypothetical protein